LNSSFIFASGRGVRYSGGGAKLFQEFLLDLLGVRQLVGYFVWEFLCESVFSHADGFVDASQGILDVDLISVSAKDDADAGIFMGLFYKIIEEIEVEIHFSCMLRLEGTDLELHGYEAG
jgi:hypothetical protein